MDNIFYERSILAFGLFASKRPVESPISKEFLFLIFGGESEWDRSIKASSGEHRIDWIWETTFKCLEWTTLWKNGSGCTDLSVSHLLECWESSISGSVTQSKNYISLYSTGRKF